MLKVGLKNIVESLYDCVCDVYERADITEGDIISGGEPVLKYHKIKCRISYRNNMRKLLTTKQTKAEACGEQSVVLFTNSEYDIKPGSVIRVYKEGITAEYKNSGFAAKYSSHQEISIERIEEA